MSAARDVWNPEAAEQAIHRALAALAGELATAGQRSAQPLAESFPRRLRELLELVQRWNRVRDLTSATSASALVDLYLADAWVLWQLGLRTADWLDVGSGGGAPGLVIALMNPRARMTLVEPRRKRAAFLRNAVGQLGLVRFTTVAVVRAEHLPPATCDVAISRAAFKPADWLVHGCRLARRQVWVLAGATEAITLPDQLSQAGWALMTRYSYHWPLTGTPRVVFGCERAQQRQEGREATTL